MANTIQASPEQIRGAVQGLRTSADAMESTAARMDNLTQGFVGTGLQGAAAQALQGKVAAFRAEVKSFVETIQTNAHVAEDFVNKQEETQRAKAALLNNQ